LFWDVSLDKCQNHTQICADLGEQISVTGAQLIFYETGEPFDKTIDELRSIYTVGCSDNFQEGELS
jgi:hypothetical protein